MWRTHFCGALLRAAPPLLATLGLEGVYACRNEFRNGTHELFDRSPTNSRPLQTMALAASAAIANPYTQYAEHYTPVAPPRRLKLAK
jgi:hypothetical protein